MQDLGIRNLLLQWLVHKPSVQILLDLVPAVNLNPLNAELNPICCLLTLLGAHHILHVSRIRVNV